MSRADLWFPLATLSTSLVPALAPSFVQSSLRLQVIVSRCPPVVTEAVRTPRQCISNVATAKL
eukprot:357413-Prorocentrum_minimum.AAC.3